MKMKSIFQLLTPFAVTVVFYIVWCIFWSIFGYVLDGLHLIHGNFSPFNVIDFEDNAVTSVIFWIINVVLIIYAEIYVTSEFKE